MQHGKRTADQDEANVDLPVLSTDVETSFEFLQRYILALFFFALDGPKWPQNVGFMSSASVCDWNFDRKFGAMCNDANAVNNIFISTLLLDVFPHPLFH